MDKKITKKGNSKCLTPQTPTALPLDWAHLMRRRQGCISPGQGEEARGPDCARFNVSMCTTGTFGSQ